MPEERPRVYHGEPDMRLPEGKICGDCRHFKRCEWLISCGPANVECDWSPSRFSEKPKEKVDG